MKAILDGIWTRLSGSTVYTTLGGRIYLNQGPADALLPLMIYSAPETSVETLFGGIVKYQLDLEFTIFYDNSGTAATGFDRVSFVRLNGGVPAFSDDSWSMTERYRATAFDI